MSYNDLVKLKQKLAPNKFEIVGPDAFFIGLRRARGQ